MALLTVSNESALTEAVNSASLFHGLAGIDCLCACVKKKLALDSSDSLLTASRSTHLGPGLSNNECTFLPHFAFL